MSSINFPNNPVINDTFTSNGLTYEFDGDKWTSVVDLTASAVEYDPTVSGLIATDVQAAVDEITSDLNNLEQNSISDADSNVTVTDNSKISFVFNNVEEAFINANGLTVTEITETSSLRYKENIRPLNNALNAINQMRGVIYDRKDEGSKDEIGLIAEELYEIVPELVKLDSEGRPDSIHYTRIISYLIEAIKELEQKIG